MAAVESQRVDVILTEDISRISRDFADSAHVFKRLQYAQVPLIGIADGIADGINTSTRDANLSFTLKILVADIYFDDLRDKTLRGLEGRAGAGYATGNTPYGFRSVPETDSYGQVRGHRIEIDPVLAAIVVRIL
jgi:site-specific DNA recombinase